MVGNNLVLMCMRREGDALCDLRPVKQDDVTRGGRGPPALTQGKRKGTTLVVGQPLFVREESGERCGKWWFPCSTPVPIE